MFALGCRPNFGLGCKLHGEGAPSVGDFVGERARSGVVDVGAGVLDHVIGHVEEGLGDPDRELLAEPVVLEAPLETAAEMRREMLEILAGPQGRELERRSRKELRLGHGSSEGGARAGEALVRARPRVEEMRDGEVATVDERGTQFERGAELDPGESEPRRWRLSALQAAAEVVHVEMREHQPITTDRSGGWQERDRQDLV